MPRLSLALPFVLSVLASALPAQVWPEAGDAGDLPGTAQQTQGPGNLTQIQGAIGAGDVDLYVIHVFDTGTFQASTIGGASFDTQLYLFDEYGVPVVTCDNTPVSQQSLITGQYLLAPGRYYLAVAHADRDPSTVYGPWWYAGPTVGEQRLALPADRLKAWSGGLTSPGGSYTVSLTGAAFAPNELEVPSWLHLSEGAAHTDGSPNYWRPAPTGHFQLLWQGSHFLAGGVTGPVTLTRLQMRGEDGEPNVGGQVYQNVTVRVGSTSLTPATMSTNFAANLLPGVSSMLSAVIAAKTIKKCVGTVPNNCCVDLSLHALGISVPFNPTSAQPNLLLDVTWTSAGPGPSGSDTIAIQDVSGTPAVVGGRGLFATSSTATIGTFTDPAMLQIELSGGGGDDVLIPATVESIGAACGGSAASVYQSLSHGGGNDRLFDQPLAEILLTPDVYPNPTRYTVSQGTTPVDLTMLNPAASLTVEDGNVMHALPGTFSFPGGSTNTIWADDNGFVRLTNQMVASPWLPTIPKWLGATGEGPRFAPLWTDFSSGRNVVTHPGSGLHVRNSGSRTFTTWRNVGRFNSVAVPGGQSVNTVQCVMDTATGSVSFRYGPMGPIHGGSRGGALTGIVGFTRGNVGGVPAVDPGSTDFWRELPRTTAPESAANMLLTAVDVVTPVPANAPGRLFAGNQVRWNVANVPAGADVGVQLIDLDFSRPGLPLLGVGGPGCILSTGIAPIFHEVTVPPASGSLPFGVPPGFDGVRVQAQYAAIDFDGALTIWASNTLQHTIGRR